MRITALIVAVMLPAFAFAQTPDAPDTYDPHKSLLFLGQDFANKIGNDLKKADLYLSGAGKMELAEQKAHTILPDDEPLLIHLSFTRDRISGAQDVLSIKHNGRLMMSIGDFAQATGVAIKVNSAESTAKGWFFRQTQTFALDAKKREVAIAGKVATLAADDITIDGQDILVDSALLEKWFGVVFDYDFASLSVNVTSMKTFPVEEAYERSRKFGSKNYGNEPAALPYQPVEYGLYSLPFMDTNINGRIIHTDGQAPLDQASWSTILNGDYGGFGVQGFLNGHERTPYLDTARLTFTKEDYEGNLLGPLHAKRYQFGDVSTVSNPIIGGGAEERGVTISSKLTDTVTTDTTTQIRGDATPGWDVELYRNNLFLDIRHVDVDGRYDFGNIDLIVGDNDFKFIFYGPEGEVREEHKHVGVNTGALAKGTHDYAFSVSQNAMTTWQRVSPQGPDVGTPRVSGRYEYGLPVIGTISFGAENVDTQGKNRNFFSTGLASYFLDTFFNADVGYDDYHGAYSTTLTARRNFAEQSALLQYTMNSPTFNPSSLDFPASTKDSYRASIGGPMLRAILPQNRLNYSLAGGYTELYGGATQTSVSASVSAAVKSIILSTSLSEGFTSSPPDPATPGSTATTSRALSGSTNAHGFLYDGSWRLGTDYTLLPNHKITNVNADYTRSINDRMDVTTSLNYQPDPTLLSGAIGLNWRASKATISPRVSFDTHHNATLGVNVHFSAGADPYAHDYHVYNKYLSDSGGVAARIFRDKNGDGVYDAGDELLPDVALKAVQEHRTGISNAEGIAFIPDLEKYVLTDIIIDTATLPDSYDMTLYDGAAIRQHTGGTAKFEFPVVTAGEMDGQAEYTDKTGANQLARGLEVSLIAPNGKVEKTTVAASDGYWSLSSIRPGIYYMTAAADDSMPGYLVPRLIEFKPDGTTYFGQAIKMQPGHNTVFSFSSTNDPPDGELHTRVIRPDDIVEQHAVLKIGHLHSRLAMAVSWFKLKRNSALWQNAFDLTTPIGSIKPDPKTGEMTMVLSPRKTMSIETAALSCQGLADMGLNCDVEVISQYRGAVPPPAPAAEESAPVAAASSPAPVVMATAQPAPPAPVAQEQPLVVVRPKNIVLAAPNVVAELEKYAAANPAINKDALRERTVILNLGSYNSRELMGVIWFKVKTRYGSIVSGAHLLVQPSQSLASSETGKHTLRIALPNYDLQDAENRCRQLNEKGQACTVEALPDGLQSSVTAEPTPKG